MFRDVDGQTHCTIRPFRDGNPDIARDPFSTNRCLFDSGGIELFGSMVVAGPTTDVIYVLIPDNTTCSADEISPADLQHVIGIRLGPAENLGSTLPREDLHWSLCESSLRPTQDSGSPSLLGTNNAPSTTLAECQQYQLPSLSPPYKGEYVATSTCLTHR